MGSGRSGFETDHPRVCGEQLLDNLVYLLTIGSPPRVRGTGKYRKAGRNRMRITPACAGNSDPEEFADIPMEDHPRVCGEQCPHSVRQLLIVGSPPRVRGTVRYTIYRYHTVRITPACAGNSQRQSDIEDWRRDHPRVCGEQNSFMLPAEIDTGSPPRVRGTVPAPDFIRLRYGITPACAGNSFLKLKRLAQLKDHPRVCGEQLKLIDEGAKPQGSPPRVRGTAALLNGKGFFPGITPACAGNSPFPYHLASQPEDHPRVCGEQLAHLDPHVGCLGSPPRVRGTGCQTLRCAYADRITPACAGNRH